MRKRSGLVRAGLIASVSGLAMSAFTANVNVDWGDADEDLEASLAASSQVLSKEREDVTDAQELFAASQSDYRNLLAALYDAGHYEAAISIQLDGREAEQISPLDPPANINQIAIRVVPGPEFEFGRAVVAPLPQGTSLPDGFRTGAPARSGLIEDAARAAADGWREAGHAKVDLAEQSVVADHPAERLDVTVRLAPGARATFGQLNLAGESAVREERIRAIAGFPMGEIYEPEKATRVATRLRRTGAFRSVSLREAEALNADDSLDFTATIADEKPRRIGGGVEFSSIDGLSLSGYWLHRNLLGGAERFRIDAGIAQIGAESEDDPDLNFGLRFERPAFFYPDNTFVVEFGYENVDEPGYEAENFEGQIGAEWIWSDALSFGGGLGFLVSSVQEDDRLRRDEFELLTLPLFVTYDKRDDEIDPANGYYLAGTLTPFTAIGDNGGTGARITADMRGYYGIDMGAMEDRLVLAGRAQLGSVVGADFRDVPPDYRFFSGGGGTVRGQDYNSLGIFGSSDRPVGGIGFVGLSAELRFDITDTIGVVGFADYGVVSADSFPGSGDPDHAGAGLGARYNTGIGPIRLDVALPADEDIGDFTDNVEVYIGIGQAF